MPLLTTRLVPSLAFALGVAVALTGCTGDPAPNAAAPADSSNATSEGGSTEPTESESGAASSDEEAAETAPAREQSPLEKFFGEAGVAVSQSTAEDRATRHLMMEEGIAECMRDEGFEYDVVPWNGEEDPQAMGWTDESLREFGYGVTTLLGSGDAESYEPHPNDAREEAMSPAERKAYITALQGFYVEGEDDGSEHLPEKDPNDKPLREYGCVGKVEFELFGETAEEADAFRSDTLMPFVNELASLSRVTDEDPRTVAARNAWSECVADAGFPGISERWEASALIEKELSEQWDGEIPSAHDPKLAELRQRELSLAQADVECSHSTRLDEITTEVQHDVEADYIEENRAELEAMAVLLAEHNQALDGMLGGF